MIMNELQIFNNSEFGQIRTIVIDDEPWFVGKDIASSLGYVNPRDAISRHVDDDDKVVVKCDTLKGMQDMTVINESGLYSLIFGSKLESAKKFKHWVTSEVLPQLRRTGTYRLTSLSKNPVKLLEAHYEAIKFVDNKVDTLAERVDKIEMDLPILPIEADLITEAVKRKGVSILGGKLSAAYNNRGLRKKVFSSIYSNMKYNFGIRSYKALKRSQCDKAIEIITDYKPPVFLITEIEQCNNQMSL